MKRYYYFAYGSNLNIDRMRSRIGYRPKYEKGILYDYQFRTNKKAYTKGFGFANVEPMKGRKVEGKLYLLTNKDFKKLDIYEGFPTQYTRLVVNIKLFSGKKIKAITYIASNPINKDLKISYDYAYHIEKGLKELSKYYSMQLLALLDRLKGFYYFNKNNLTYFK